MYNHHEDYCRCYLFAFSPIWMTITNGYEQYLIIIKHHQPWLAIINHNSPASIDHRAVPHHCILKGKEGEEGWKRKGGTEGVAPLQGHRNENVLEYDASVIACLYTYPSHVYTYLFGSKCTYVMYECVL